MIVHRYASSDRSSERGTALVMMTFAAAALAGLSAALLGLSHSGALEQRSSKELVHARYVAEAGISAAVFDLECHGTGNLGSEDDPVEWGQTSYWVTRLDVPDPGGPEPLVQLIATGIDDRVGSRVEAVLEPHRSTIFRWAAFGDEFTMLNSFARVDSYNSTLGTYASQTYADPDASLGTHGLTNGDVGSNANILLYANSKVFGDAVCGPTSSTTETVNADVTGSSSPAAETMELPPIEVPSFPSSGALTVTGTQTLASGNYNFTSMRLQAGTTLNVVGPAKIVVANDFQIRSHAKLLVNATNGPVEIWVEDDFVVGSNTLMSSTTNTPLDLRINLLSDNVISPEVIVDLDVIDFDSNAKMYGTIYAPHAAIEVDSNFELFGSLVARSLDLDSNSRIHYDESLGTAESLSEVTYSVLCWRPLPFHLD